MLCNHSAMVITIDKAGRVVIPRSVRTKLGLEEGVELELTVEGSTVCLTRHAPPPTLAKRNGRTVVRPQAEPGSVDVAALIEEARNRWPT